MTTLRTHDLTYDVAIVSDFRYPGGTSASVVEEIRAQSQVGLSTILVHVPSPHLRLGRDFNPRIVECIRDGSADLATPGNEVSVRVMVLRQPRIFTAELKSLPKVRGDEVVMVINQAPSDATGERIYYDIFDVHERVERYFGAVRWVTIGPLVREQVLRAAPDFPLQDKDWHNIIDVSSWWTERVSSVGDVPTIGRHGRPDPLKWPSVKEDILRAYPVDSDFRVRILGGGEIALERLGFVPDSWDVLPFGSIHPREFLRTIDYFVYFHDPTLVEAFGRTILEAMASGTPVILPDVFRTLFEDAAIYATPDQVRGIVTALHADWSRYCETSARARAFVNERFGYSSHIQRLAKLGAPITPGGRVGGAQVAPTIERASQAAWTSRRTVIARIMMLSSNGAGLGHLTRLMAIARRMRPEIQTIIATQSHAAPLVQQNGLLTEYIPSRGYLDIPAGRWNEFLHDRLLHLIHLHQPDVVAVDGTAPYNGLLGAMRDHPEVTWVWVRRAMWKPNQGNQWIERGQAFDFVLEPGEFAAALDEGPTVAERENAVCVDPIVYLDESELVDADSARRALNLDEGPTALIQLGAGNINDISSLVARVADFLARRGFQVVLARSPIAITAAAPPAGVQVASLFPLSRYLRAIDLAVSAAGYNSFHELIRFSVPTIFLPNIDTALDDQAARVRYAESVGAALGAYNSAGHEIFDVLERAVDPDVRAHLRERCAYFRFGDGAAEAAAWLGTLCPEVAGLPGGGPPGRAAQAELLTNEPQQHLPRPRRSW